jgi:ATP-binding protein involved in chromosome partitioning
MKSYKDIPGDAGSDILGQVQEHVARLQARLETVDQVLVVMSGKGGVGKSALTANLAAAFARQGCRVGVLDGDINGPCVARMVGVGEGRPKLGATAAQPAVGALGIKVMSMHLLLSEAHTPVVWKAHTQDDAQVWRGTLEVNVLRQLLADTEWGELDLLLVDLPPGPERLPSIAGLLPPSSQALAITIPSPSSHMVVAKSVALASELVTVPIVGLLENMAPSQCPHCGHLITLFPSDHDSESLAADLSVPFLGRIPFDPRIPSTLDRGIPFVMEYPDTPAARAIDECAELLKHRLGVTTSGGAT